MNVPSVGDRVPEWVVDSVDPERMKTMAALLDDSNPIHFDIATLERIGMEPRQVNQGPLNLGYVENMLEAWAGAGSIAKLTVRFQANVLAGDRVAARGTVTNVREDGEGTLVDLDVTLDIDGRGAALAGIATVFLRGAGKAGD